MKHWDRFSLVGLLAVLLAGVILEVLDGGVFLPAGWIIYSTSLGLAVMVVFTIWLKLEKIRRLLWIPLTAFLLRLAIGIALFLLLPIYGYRDNEVSQAGYVFKDAFVRDRQAWELAVSREPLNTAFSGDMPGDQYGGMLAFSALIYRYLSPDVHRPFLILILNSTVSALTVLWIWKGLRNWFPVHDSLQAVRQKFLPQEVIPYTAAWIAAIYPEGVLLGSSQMREPIVIAGIALAFYAFTKSRLSWHHWTIEMGLAALMLFLFQPPVGFITMIVLIVLFFIEFGRCISWKTLAILISLTFLGGFLAAQAWKNLPSLQNESPLQVFYLWLLRNFNLQSYMLERVSGWSQRLIQQLGSGEEARLLFVLAYGAAQPVLPAALIVPGAPVWRVIGSLRAFGWYALWPLLLYGFWSALRPISQSGRIQRLWLNVVCLAWILAAAASGGADQWDNPRYRTLFLPWLALLAAWAWWWSKAQRDPWLGRLLLVEAVFLLVFIEWYLGRYYPQTFLWTDIWVMIGITLAAGVVIFGWGWLRDRKKDRPKRPLDL